MNRIQTITSIESKPPGRPTKRTPEVIKTLLAAAATGAPVKACCSAAGIGYETFRQWADATPDLQAEFEEAREQGRIAALKVLQEAGKRDWRAAQAWLQFSFRDAYGPRAEVAIETKQDDALMGLIKSIRGRERTE